MLCCDEEQMRYRVGFYISEKKRKKLPLDDVTQAFRLQGIELVWLDIRKLDSNSMAKLGRLDAVLHKFSDVMLKAEFENDKICSLMCLNFSKYLSKFAPSILLFDQLFYVRKLCDRFDQYSLLENISRKGGYVFRTPKFIEIDTAKDNCSLMVQAAGLKYPLVCKPKVAHGAVAHNMSVVFDDQGLRNLQPTSPYVAQEFIPHNAELFKIYVLGRKFYLQSRPSLKNFDISATPANNIYFDSHKVSKGSGVADLTSSGFDMLTSSSLPDDVIQHIVDSVSKETQLTIYGLDLIICRETGTYYIIDANVFPGFDNVPTFLSDLAEFVKEKLESANQHDRARLAATNQSISLIEKSCEYHSHRYHTLPAPNRKKSRPALCRSTKEAHAPSSLHKAASGDNLLSLRLKEKIQNELASNSESGYQTGTTDESDSNSKMRTPFVSLLAAQRLAEPSQTAPKVLPLCGSDSDSDGHNLASMPNKRHSAPPVSVLWAASSVANGQRPFVPPTKADMVRVKQYYGIPKWTMPVSFVNRDNEKT